MNKIDLALTRIASHPLNRSAKDTQSLFIDSLPKSLSLYCADPASVETLSPTEVVKLMTPAFQRTNTKWNTGMKTRFIEAMLAGVWTQIKFYSALEDGDFLYRTFILDGLQRLTAIAEFCEDKIPVFDGLVFSDINHLKVMRKSRIQMQLFQFDTHLQACQHYIDINRDITHSADDLATAELFMKSHTQVGAI